MEADLDRDLFGAPLPAAPEPSTVVSPTAAPSAPAAHDEHCNHMAPEPEAGDAPLPSSTATVLRKIQKWWDYRSYGGVIAGSRVIPMKTPLTLELQERQARLATAKSRSGNVDGIVPGKPGHEQGEQQEHTIGKFVREQAAAGRTVSLIVDLSNHDCLYTEDLERECPGLAYQHFHFVAKEVPDRAGCKQVASCITAHLAAHPDHFVGIHCSYGFNRTGLVCCAYLCEELGFSVDQALATFAAARPPGVKHQHFIEALRARYGASEPSPTTTVASAGSSTRTCGSSASGDKGDGGDDSAAAGIIPPAEDCEPAHPAPLLGDSSTSGVRAGNNETLGGDVREAILAALQQHQQEHEKEVELQRQSSSVRGCGSGSCVVS